MVRQTRYLLVGNIPEKITKEKITEHFKNYGKIQNVKFHPKKENELGITATVAFMDIKCASKAYSSENKIENVVLRTEYSEGAATGSVVTRPVDPGLPTTGAHRGQYLHARGPSTSFTTRTKGSLDEDETYREYYYGGSGSSSGRENSQFENRYPTYDEQVQHQSRSYQRNRTSFSKQYERGPQRQKSGSGSVTGVVTGGGSGSSVTGVGSSNTVGSTVTPSGGGSVVGSGAVGTSSSAGGAGSGAGTGGNNSGGGSTNNGGDTGNTGVSVVVSSTLQKHSFDERYHEQYGSDRESFERPRISTLSPTCSISQASSRHSSGRRKGSVSVSRSSSRSRSRSSSSSEYSRSSSGSSGSRSHSRSRASSRGSLRRIPVGSATSQKHSKSESQSMMSSKSSTAGSQSERKPLGICVTGLPLRSSDTSLRDGLFHEYKKHGKVTSVQVLGQGEERYSVVSFRKPEDASKALEASQDKMFFGKKIKVMAHEGVEVEDNEFRPPEAECDEYHPKATRTLFVGNLEKEITTQELRDRFKSFGEIIDIDIKRQGAVSAYAFVQYADITSVVKSLRKMEGEHIGANKIKLGFGKSMPTNCVWLDNLSDSVTEKFLCQQFGRYGEVSHAVIDRYKGRALIYFTSMDTAQYAVNEMRNRILKKKRVQTGDFRLGGHLNIDFASRDCQTAFFEKMERTGQLQPGERPDERGGRLYRHNSGTNFEYYDSPATPSAYKEDSARYETGSVVTPVATTPRVGLTPPQFTTTKRSRATNFQASSTRQGSSYRGRHFSENTYSEEFPASQRQRHIDEYSQGSAPPYAEEDSYEQELREYGYSQRERRERGNVTPPRRYHSPYREDRHSNADKESTRGSRYEEAFTKDRYDYYSSDSAVSDNGHDENWVDHHTLDLPDRHTTPTKMKYSSRSETRLKQSSRDHSPTIEFSYRHSPVRRRSKSRSRSKSGSRTESPSRSRSRTPLRERRKETVFRPRSPHTPQTPPTPTEEEPPIYSKIRPISPSSRFDEYDRSGELKKICRTDDKIEGLRSSDHEKVYSMKCLGTPAMSFMKGETTQARKKSREFDESKHDLLTGRLHKSQVPASTRLLESALQDRHQVLLKKADELHDKNRLNRRKLLDQAHGASSHSSGHDDSDPGSFAETDLGHLHREKRLLLEKLKQLEDTGSPSDNDSLPTHEDLREDGHGRFVPRKGRSDDPLNLRHTLSDLHAKEKRKLEPSQSFRKQMEARRLLEQTQGEASLLSKSKKSIEKVVMLDGMDSEGEEEIGITSPKAIPTAFKPKRKKKLEEDPVSGVRTGRFYRMKKSGMMSSDDEKDHSKSLEAEEPVMRRTSREKDELSAVISRFKEQSRHSELSREVSESGSHKESREYKMVHMTSKDGMETGPKIIKKELSVDDVVQDPRHEIKKEEPLSLPLPRFALKHNASPVESPLPCPSPPLLPVGPKARSPCFSPQCSSKSQSPAMSPAGSLSDVSHDTANSNLPESGLNRLHEQKDEDQLSKDLVASSSGIKALLPNPDGEDNLSDSLSELSCSSLDEKIRQLDKKLNMTPVPRPVDTATPGLYGKFKIKKKETPLSGGSMLTSNLRSEPSDIVKSLLSRSSIFDQDSKRLEQINEKYKPKEININIEDSPPKPTIRTKAAAKEMPPTMPQNFSPLMPFSSFSSTCNITSPFPPFTSNLYQQHPVIGLSTTPSTPQFWGATTPTMSSPTKQLVDQPIPVSVLKKTPLTPATTELSVKTDELPQVVSSSSPSALPEVSLPPVRQPVDTPLISSHTSLVSPCLEQTEPAVMKEPAVPLVTGKNEVAGWMSPRKDLKVEEMSEVDPKEKLIPGPVSMPSTSSGSCLGKRKSSDDLDSPRNKVMKTESKSCPLVIKPQEIPKNDSFEKTEVKDEPVQQPRKKAKHSESSTKPKEDKESEKKLPGVPSVKPSKSPEKKLVKTPSREKNEKKEPIEGEKKEAEKKIAEMPAVKKDQKGSKDGDKSTEKCKSSGKEQVCDLDEKAKLKNSHSERKHEKSEKKEKNRSKSSDSKSDKERSSKDGEAKESHKKDKLKSKTDSRSKSKSEDKGDADASKNGRAGHEKVEAENLLKASKSHRKSEEDKGDDKTDAVKCSEANKSAKSHHRLEQPESEASTKNNKTHHKMDQEKGELETSKASKSHHKADNDKADGEGVKSSGKSHQKPLESLEKIEAEVSKNKCGKVEPEKAETENSKASKSHHKYECEKGEVDGTKPSSKSHHKHDQLKSETDGLKPAKVHHKSDKSNRSSSDRTRKDSVKSSSERKKSEKEKTEKSEKQDKSEKVDKLDKDNKNDNKDKLEKTEKSEKEKSEKEKFDKEKSDKTEKDKSDKEKSEKVEKAEKDKSEKEKSDKDKDKTEKEKQDKSKPDKEKPEKEKPDKDKQEKPDKDRQEKPEKEKPDKSEKEKPDKEKPDRSEKDRSEKDKSDRSEKPDKSEKSESTEKMDKSDKEKSEKEKCGDEKKSEFCLDAFGPYVSMYDKVKRRSCSNKDKDMEDMRKKLNQLKNTRKKRGSKPSRSDETESSVQNTDDESSTSTSFVASKKETLTEEKDETTNKKKKRNVIESSSSEEDAPPFIPAPSKRELKKSSPKTRPMHKKSKAVLDVSSDSDTEEKDYKKISSKLAKQKLGSSSSLLHEQRNNSTDTKRDSQDEMLTEKSEKPNRKKSSKDKKKKCEKEKKKSKKSSDRSSKDEKKVLPKSSPVFNDITEMPGMDSQGSQVISILSDSQYMDMAHEDSPKEDYPQMQKSNKPSVATASTVEEEEDEEENLSDVGNAIGNTTGTNAVTADEDESKPFAPPKSSKDIFPHKIESQVESLSEKLFLPISLSEATAKDSEENHHADTEDEPPDMSSKSNKSKKKKKKEKKKHEAKSKKSSKKNIMKISMLDDNVFLNDQPEATQEEDDEDEEDCSKSFQITNLDSFLLSASKEDPSEDIKVEPLATIEEDMKQEADLDGLKSTSSFEDIKAEANDVFLEESFKEKTQKIYMESPDQLPVKVEELPKEELDAEEEEEEEEEEEVCENETIDSKQNIDSLIEGNSNNLEKYETLQEDVYDFDKSENITEKLTDSEQLKKFDKIYDSDKVKKVSEEMADSDIPKSVEEESPEFLLSSAEEVNEEDTDQPEPTPEEPSDLDTQKDTVEDIPAGSPEHSDTKELDSPYQLKEQEDTASSDVFTDLKKLDKSSSEVEEDGEDSKSLAKESQNIDLLEKEETEKAEEESKSPEATEMGKDLADESCETTVDGEDVKPEENKEPDSSSVEKLTENSEKVIGMFNFNLLQDDVDKSTDALHKVQDTELSEKGSHAALNIDQVLDKANSNTDANKNVDHIYDFDDTTEDMYANTYLDKRENKSGPFNYKKVFMIPPRKTDKIYNSDVTKKICEKIEQKISSLEPPNKFETIFKKINEKVYNRGETNSTEIYEDEICKTRGRITDLHYPQQHTDKSDGDVYDFDEQDKLEVNELLDSKKTDHKIHDLHDDKKTEEHLQNFDGGKKNTEKLARFQDWFVNDDKKYYFDSVKDFDSKPNKSRSKCGKHKSGQGKRRNKGKNVTFTWPREMDLKSTVESATDNDNVSADTLEMKESDYNELDDQEDKLVIDTSDMCVNDENSTEQPEKECDKAKLCESETKSDNDSALEAEKSQEILDVKEKGSGEEEEEEPEEREALDTTAFKHYQDAFGMSVKQKLVQNYELTNHSGSTPDKIESVLGFGMLDGNKDLLTASKLSDDCDSSDEGALRIDEDEVDENTDRDETTLDKLPEKEKEDEEEEETVEKPGHYEVEEEEISKTGYDDIKEENQDEETRTPTSTIATPEIEAAKDEDSQETILDPEGNYQVLEDFETTFAGKVSPVTDNRPSSSCEIETALEASDKELKDGSNSREATPSPDNNMDLETLKAIEMLQESLMKTDTELNDPEPKKDDFYPEPKENIKSGSEENRSTNKLEEDQYECTDSGIVRANQENFKTSEAWTESGISGVNISPSVDYEEPVPSQRRSSRKGRHRERKERKCRASRRDANKKKDGIFSRSMLRDGSSGSPEVLSTLQNFDLKSQPIEKNSSFDCYQFEDEYDVIPTLYPRSSDSKLLNQHLVISNVKMEPELICKETSLDISKLDAHSPSSENKNVTMSKYALKPKEELDEDSAAEEKPSYLKDKNLKVESESSSHEKDDDEAEDMADPIKDEPTSLSIVLKKEKIEGDKDREEQYKVETIEKPLKLEDDKPKGRKRRLRRNSRKQTAVSSLDDVIEKPLEDIKTVWTTTPASAVNTPVNQESANKGEEVQEKETDITALAVADLIKAEFPDPVSHTQEPLTEIPTKEIQMEKDTDTKASLPVSELETKKSVVPIPIREYPKRNRSKTSAAAASMAASNMQVTPTGGRRTRASKYEEKQVLAAAAAEEESVSEASKVKEEPQIAVTPEASVSQPVVKVPVVEDKLKEKKVEIPPIRFQRETNRRGRTRGFTLRRGPPTEEPTEIPTPAEDTAEKTFQKAKDVFDFDDDDDEAMDTPKLETVRAVQRPERHAKDDHLTSKLEPALSEAATPTHKAAVAESQKSSAIPSLDIDESTKLENQVEYQRSRRGRKPNYKAMDSGVLPRTTSPRTRMSSPKTRSPKATRQQTQSQAQVAAAATTPAAVASSSPKTTEVGSPVVKLEKLPLVTRSSKKEEIKNLNFKEEKPSLKVTLRPEPIENDSLVLSSGTEEEMSDSKKSTLIPTSPPPPPPQQSVETVIVTRRGKGRKRKGASAAAVAASTPALPVTAEPKVTVPEVKITSPQPPTANEATTEDETENPVSNEAPSEMMNQPTPFTEVENKEMGTNLIADSIVPEVSLSPKTQTPNKPLPQSQSQPQVIGVNTTSVSLPTETTPITTSSTIDTSSITSTTTTVSTTPAPCTTTTTVSSAMSSETHLANQVQASSTENVVETVPHLKIRRDSDSDVTMIPGPGVIQPIENVSTTSNIANKPSLVDASAGRPRQSRSRSRSSELILNALNSPQGVMSHNRGSLAAALHAPMSADIPSTVVMSPSPVMTMTSESPVRMSEINKPLYSPMVMEPIGSGPGMLDMKPPVEQNKQPIPHTVDLTKSAPDPPAPKQSVMEAMLKQPDENPSKHALDTSETVRMILEKHAPMPGKLSSMEPKHPTDLHKPKHDSVKHLKENLKIMDPAKHPAELLKHQLDPVKHHKDNIKHTAVIHQLTDNKTFSHQSVPISNIRTGPSVSSENLISSRPCPQPVHGSVIHLTQPLPHQSPHHEHSMAHKSMVGMQRSHGYYDQPQERSRSSSPHVITPPSTMSTPVSHIYSGPSHQAMSGCINLKTEHSGRDYGVVTTTVAHTIDKSMVNSPHPLTTTSPSYLGQDVKRSQMHGGVQMGVVQIQPVSSKEASPKGQVRLTIEKVPNPLRGNGPPQSMESGPAAMGLAHERMPDTAERLRQKAEMSRPTSSVSEQQHKGHHGKSATALSMTMSQSAGQQRVWKQSPPPQQLIRHIAISPSPSPTLHATNLSVSHQQASHQGGAQQQQQQQQQQLSSQPHSAQSLTTHQLLSGGQQQHLARSSPNMLPGVHPGSHGTVVSSASSSSSGSVAVTSAHSQIQHQLQAANAAHQREREREPAPNQSPAHQPSGHQAHNTPVSAHQGQSVEMRQVGSSVVHRLPYHLVDGRMVSSSGDPKSGQPSVEARLAAQLSQSTHPAHYTPDRRGEKIATTPSAFSPPDARSVHEVQQQQQQPQQPPPQTFYPSENIHVSRGIPFPQGHIPLPMTRLPVEHVAAVYASPQHSFLTVPEGTIVQTQPHHPHYQHGGYLSQQHGIALERVPIESRPPSRPPSRPDKRPPSNPNQAAGGPAAVVKAHVQQPPPGSPGLDGVKLIHGNLTVASQALVNQQNKLSYDTIAMLQMIHEMWFTHKKYQIVWQGFLALKNDNVIVQMHLMSGNRQLIAPSMPQMASDGTMQPLRISQRMRLEPIQVEGVAKRMQLTEEYCMLLALPNGRDHLDILHQTRALSNGFISYLSSKQAAGIVNVANPESQQPAYVVHIFPPCEFSRLKLREAGFELMNQVTDFAHLVIVITTV